MNSTGKLLFAVAYWVIVATVQLAFADTNVVSFAETNIVVMENAGAVTVSVTRTGATFEGCSARLRTVRNTAVAGRDYVAVTGIVEFVPGQSLVQQTISLLADTIPEPTESFIVALDAFSNCVPDVATNVVIVQDAQTRETMAQDFESGLPIGWCVTTNADTNGCWRFDNPGGRPNATGGKGVMAIADSDYAGQVAMDTELRTVPFAVASTALTYLVYKTYYNVCSGYEIADVDISISGGDGPWANLWRKQSDEYFGPAEIIDLTPLAKGQSNVMVRFHYYNANYDNYWEIDDVAILVEPDSNTNGLPDWWETAYYSAVTNVLAGDDSDEDGACNEAEFIAGTSPMDTGSCFKVEGMIRSNAAVVVQFPTVPWRFYDVLSATNLMQQWTNRIGRMAGRGGDTNISLSAPGAQGFYKVNVHRW